MYVHELKRYQSLENAAIRAARQADRLHHVDFDRACKYDDMSDTLMEKAFAVKDAVRNYIRSLPPEERKVQRGVFYLARRLTGIRW